MNTRTVCIRDVVDAISSHLGFICVGQLFGAWLVKTENTKAFVVMSYGHYATNKGAKGIVCILSGPERVLVGVAEC